MTVVRKRGAALSDLLGSKVKPQDRSENSFWNELNRRIREGTVIPVVSNSVRSEGIFHLDDPAGEEPAPEGEEASHSGTTENELAQLWAQQIGYPLSDSHEMARVAQYNRVISDDAESAKAGYLEFLRNTLLAFAELKGADPDLLDELRARAKECSFSDLVKELDYPQFPEGQLDPLRILARLPLPIYVTTSYHDYLERALTAEGKKPRTQVCFWSGELLNVEEEHETDYNMEPTPECPLVYHLLGFERYPTSIAISEDDYLDFLVKISQDHDSRNPVIPLYLREALSVSSLILLGYRLQDWDFRVLFRGIVNPQANSLRWFSLIIQLTPEMQFQIENSAQARHYLENYFGPSRFKVEWGNTDDFLNRLWEEWRKWRQGQ
jgi:hypothetical protein